MSGVATNWASTRGTLVGAGVPFVYILSIPQGNVKWILEGCSQPILSLWVWTNEDYSVLSPFENKMGQDETEPLSECIATTIPFVV